MIKDMGNMKNGKYRETSKMSDLICENYPMVLVMSRFGIDLGFGEKNIGEVCRQNKIDTYTFLTVVNFLTEKGYPQEKNKSKKRSIPITENNTNKYRKYLTSLYLHTRLVITGE